MMSLSDDAVRDMVRRVVLRTLGTPPPAPAQPVEAGAPTEPANRSSPPRSAGARPALTEADVLAVPQGGTLEAPAGTLVTPLARDTARDRRVEIVEGTPVPAPARGADPARTVALGADHGGVTLKEEIKTYLGELGYGVVDCGTHGPAAVDYPDFAFQVARLVADGRAGRGIVIDGAGIGSCMAANKVPGVRAAMCHDHATAVNSREHNDANVLTLGGALIGPALARQIVKAWLETAFGGGRHARRVDKIMAIERRYLKS